MIKKYSGIRQIVANLKLVLFVYRPFLQLISSYPGLVHIKMGEKLSGLIRAFKLTYFGAVV